MDYRTKPVSRKHLRVYAQVLRKLFDVPQDGPFPVLTALERVSDYFDGCCFLVVKDKNLPKQTPARCIPNDNGGFTIEIKQSVYDGAFERHIGAYLGFICHEICHIFLFSIGYRPLYERSFANNTLPAYCSVEWQAKALSGEVMIPYHESRGMGLNEIMETYHVSQGFAKTRISL